MNILKDTSLVNKYWSHFYSGFPQMKNRTIIYGTLDKGQLSQWQVTFVNR